LHPLILRHKKHPLLWVFFCLAILFNESSCADEISVAVASNFAYTPRLLSADFEEQTGHKLRISSASTGKLYTQIEHGAPFDVFLSADEKRPELLVAENKAEPSSEYVYARGRIVLLSNLMPTTSCQDVLTSTELKHLSIANPEIAPYGVAAKQVMEKLELWAGLQSRLVKGENIAQTLQFVTSKNAQAGFVAESMLHMGVEIDSACIWDIPTVMYSPIKQKMVILSKAKDNVATQEFFRYIKTPHAKEIIRSTGYDVL
jgi:molybdate transport system substrate-binding protein